MITFHLVLLKDGPEKLLEVVNNTNEYWAMIVSAGLAITYGGKILLVHPTRAKHGEMWSIPKGKQENGETLLETACREVAEETGVVVDPSEVTDEPMEIVYTSSRGKPYKKMVYYHYPVSGPEDVGLTSDTVPKEALPPRENKAARFVGKDEAESVIFWRMRPILELI